MPRLGAALLGAFGVFLLASPAWAQAPPRDAPPASQAKPGTGTIRGRVLASDTGQPLRKAQVRINSVGAGVGPGQPGENRLVTTDASGRFEFKELRAGRYNLNAQKNSYVGLQWGQLRPNEPGKPIELEDGQTLEKVDFTLPKGGAITGRILDEFGEPTADVQVVALRSQNNGGTRRLFPAGRTAGTNDLGEFRLFALPPGEYYLSATLRSNFGGENTDDRTGYAPTYYPGTPDVSAAQKLTIAAGQTISDLTLALLPIRTARITGTAVDSQGQPLRGVVQAFQRTSFQSGPSFGAAGRIGPDGSFTLNGLAPGDYTVHAQTQPQSPGSPTGDPEYASADVAVTGADVTDLRLVGAKPSAIVGRILLPADAGTLRPSTIRVTAAPFAAAGGSVVPGPIPQPRAVNDDWTFQARARPGPTRLQLQGLVLPWTVKAIRYRGIDVIDSGLDVRPNEDISELEVEITNRVTELTGAVTSSRGDAVTDFWLIVFPRDRDKRRPPSRYVRTMRPPQDGRFKGSGLPPGDYLALAVDYVDLGEVTDPEFLERLESRATSFSLREGEQKTLDLKLSAIP